MLLLIVSSSMCSNNPMTQRGKCLLGIKHRHVSLFVNSIWDEALVCSQKYNIPMALILGQACFESGHGRSKYAKERCNVFGIRVNHEYVTYNSLSECFDHYGRTLNLKCYKNLQPVTLEEWYEALTCCKYARSKRYITKLNRIIFCFNFDKVV